MFVSWRCFEQANTWVDPHLVRFVPSTEYPAKSSEFVSEQDDVCKNDNESTPEKDDRRKSELSENLKYLECIFATNAKETPSTTTTTTSTSKSKDELDSTKETDNQNHEDVQDLEENSPVLNIEHPLEKTEKEDVEDETDFVKEEKAEDEPAEECETESQNGSDEDKKGDQQSNKTSGDQIDHITGDINHIDLNYFLILVPDADGLSSQASFSSLYLANTVREAVQGLGLFWVPPKGAPYARVSWDLVQ